MNFKSFMMYINFTYFIVQFLSCSVVFCLHDFRFITLREYELLCRVFSTTQVFLFLFFSSEQSYYQNRRYRKKYKWILCRSHCFSNLCPPNLWIQQHSIYTSGAFCKRMCTTNKWNKIFFCTFKTPMKKPFTRLHQTWGKQSMHKLLGTVGFFST